MSGKTGVLRHAVEALPAGTVRWQARRAELLVRAPPLDPGALPGSVALTPGADHAVYARRAGIVSAVLGLIAVPMLRDESVLLEFRLMACLPLAVMLWLTVDFLHLSRVLPKRMTLRLSTDGVEIETERGTDRRPFSAFEGVAIRRRVLSRGLPERHLRRRTIAETRDRMWEPRTLYWIELTDTDYRLSVPLWVATVHDAFGRATVLRTATGFAAALGLPLISSGGIDIAEAGRADALPGLAAAPVELRAMAVREAVEPEARVRERYRAAPRAAALPPRRPEAIWLAPLLYALAVVPAGGALWIIRVAGFEAELGLTSAVAAEMVGLWLVCLACCGIVIMVGNVSPRPWVRLWMGGGAVTLLLAAEVALSLWMFGETPAGLREAYARPVWALRLAGQLVVALIPVLVLLIPSSDEQPPATAG